MGFVLETVPETAAPASVTQQDMPFTLMGQDQTVYFQGGIFLLLLLFFFIQHLMFSIDLIRISGLMLL